MQMSEALTTGYVKLHRAFLGWEWSGDAVVVAVFIHILLRVNREAKRWQGIDIPAGSLLTSRDSLARYCGLTDKQVRRALCVMAEAETITTMRAGSGQLVTLRGWAEYQESAKMRADRGPVVGPTLGSKQGRTRANGRADDETLETLHGQGQDEVTNVNEGRTRANGRAGSGPVEGHEKGHNIRSREVEKEHLTDVLDNSDELFKSIDAVKKTTFRLSAVGNWETFRSLVTMRQAEAVGVDVGHYFRAIMRWNDTGKGGKRTAQGWVSTVEAAMERDRNVGKLVKIGAKAEEKDLLLHYLKIGRE